VNVVGSDPTVLLVSVFVTKPFDIVSELHSASPIQFGVDNNLDFEMSTIVVNFNSAWRFDFSTRERVRRMKFEL
jgi:hypothetical protein